jgi:alkylmercury lyase
MKKEELDLQELISSFPDEFLKLSPEEQRVSVQLYRLLAEGQPVPPERIAQTLSLSNDVVSNILSQWSGVFYDDDGRIVGYWGLALPEMAHRFTVNGQTLYTWCAWDSLFIPQILGKTTRVESTCPVTGDKIRLTVAPEGVTELDPVGTVMSFVRPEAGKIRENVVLNFCHFVHFFSSAEAGSQWISENKGNFILSIDEAYYLAQKKNEVQYKDVLETPADEGLSVTETDLAA